MAPAALPRFIRIPGDSGRYIALETLIRRKTDYLFPKYEVLRGGAFRIIRDSDIEVEEEAEDLVRYFRTAIKRRRRGRVVRLELEPGMPDSLVDVVLEGLDAQQRDHLRKPRLPRHGRSCRCWSTRIAPTSSSCRSTRAFPERIREHGGDCFAAIREKDILVHHPYESFEVVVAFIQQAAADPDVVAIKQTLYRAGNQSAIIRALIDAAEAGKSVTAVIELKARFDEEQNLHVGERAGTRRRAGGLRLHRLEDPRQGLDGGAARGEGLPHLLPLRHRQLSSGHGARCTRISATSPPTRRPGAMRPSCSTTSPAISSRENLSSW